MKGRLLLLDIGNTHTHVGTSGGKNVRVSGDIPTVDWKTRKGLNRLKQWLSGEEIGAVALCSVVPAATPKVMKAVRKFTNAIPLVLGPKTVAGIGIDYPHPATIGPDRLANAIAARHRFGAPSVVVDFGTAVTFDVVDRRSNYIGGIIAPGLSAMTDYLHEKSALLPRIAIRETNAVIGRNTEEAMLIGAIRGYRAMIRELLHLLSRELKTDSLPVVATGGYARLMASKIPEITAVDPKITLDGLRIAWLHANEKAQGVRQKVRTPSEVSI